jgi:hypothetical protein
MYDRRKQSSPETIGKYLGDPGANGRHKRVGRAKVDTHRMATLMRQGGLAGFRNL